MRQDSAQPQPTPNSRGRVVIVKVTAEPGGKEGVSFGHRWRFDSEAEENEQVDDIRIPKREKDEPGTTIRFKLHDKSGLGLTFDKTDPMWVDRSECPNHSREDPEIPKGSISATDKELTVYNRNTEECTLNYALRFKDVNGESRPYDPAIRNGGMVQ